MIPKPKFAIGSKVYHLYRVGFWYVSPTQLIVDERVFDRLTTRPEKSCWLYSIEAKGSGYVSIAKERDLRESLEIALAIAAKRNHKIQHGKT